MSQSSTNIRIISNFIFICLFPALLYSQDCFDADFESGTVGGYDAYHGSISTDGVVIFPNNQISQDQHKIMRITDGYDPIAEQFCIENKNLLVAGIGTGRYTLRLGDSENGARTSKIVLSFTVTSDVSFFLLKYAVVLNDPQHEDHQQPRFELYIKDQNGEILDCGEYKVRAAANIPGFESCGEWRVRPWTTAGFELESYLGQTINIEIISTDCGLGGHGGYAYIDATCTPLQLILDSYCPGEGYAKYIVTDGFESYQWSTGDTGQGIDIENPVPGTEYSVTVTSATGCTLVLTDTLPQAPQLEDLIPSYFNEPDTINACFGEEITYQPVGENIGVVECIELGYSTDIFYFFADEQKTYHFITSDNFGCEYDTTHLFINVVNIDLEFEIRSACDNEDNGEILIDNLGDPTLMTALNGTNYTSNYYYTGLSQGNYVLNITNDSGCEFAKNLTILPKASPELQSVDVKPATCNEDNGRIKLNVFGSLIEYSIDDINFTLVSTFENLAGGTYTIRYQNQHGCIKEEIVFVDTFDPPEISIISTDSVYCGKPVGEILTNGIKGYPPLTYSLNNDPFVSGSLFEDLSAGDYNVIVEDDDGCTDTVSTTIYAVPYTLIGDVEITRPYCDENNGTLLMTPEDSSLPIKFYMDNVEYTNYFQEDLDEGLYSVKINDRNNCLDSMSIFIERAISPQIHSIEFLDRICGEERSAVLIHAETYNGIVSYSYEGERYRTSNEFSLYDGDNAFRVIDDLDCITDTIVNVPDIDNYAIANIFTPNEDDINDEFCFQQIEGVSEVLEFQVFDRWGNQVFGLTGAGSQSGVICWDGRSKNKTVVSGVYMYEVRVKLLDGRLLCKYGDVTVIK